MGTQEFIERGWDYNFIKKIQSQELSEQGQIRNFTRCI